MPKRGEKLTSAPELPTNEPLLAQESLDAHAFFDGTCHQQLGRHQEVLPGPIGEPCAALFFHALRGALIELLFFGAHARFLHFEGVFAVLALTHVFDFFELRGVRRLALVTTLGEGL